MLSLRVTDIRNDRLDPAQVSKYCVGENHPPLVSKCAEPDQITRFALASLAVPRLQILVVAADRG